MLKTLTIKTKIYAIVITSILSLIVIGVFFMTNMNDIKNLETSLLTITEAQSHFINLENKHLKWKAKVSDALLNNNLTQLKIKTDPHTCALGTWFYGKGRSELIALVPQIAPIINKIELPHTSLHHSIKPLKEAYQQSGRTGAIKYFTNHTEKHVAKVGEILNQANAILKSQKEHLTKVVNTKVTRAKNFVIRFLIIVIILMTILGIILSSSIIKPMQNMMQLLSKLAGGNLTIKMPDDELNTELGYLAKNINIFSQKIHILVQNTKNNITTLVSSSEQQLSTSLQISSAANHINEESTSVAASTEQASTNITNISDAANDMTDSVSTVAAAIEEMTASITDIAQNCQKECAIASNAENQAKETNKTMKTLEKSAEEIGKVLDVIKDIAAQTNLLALNATIEAASAGEAGKGFAVVANEVKELAKQTATAIEQIEGQITNMHTNTNNAVNAIENITEVIADVNSISQSIVVTVEEQSSTINEISRSVTDVNNKSNDVSQNVQESAKGIQDISKSISGFNTSITKITGEVNQVKSGADDLSTMAENLQQSVSQFIV